MTTAERVSQWLPTVWVLVVLLFLLWALLTGAIADLLRKITRVSGFGISFDFNASTASRTRVLVESELAAIRERIRRELDAEVRTLGIDHALKSAIDTIPSLATLRADEFRATLHISDPLYENYLYQLIDYHPKGGGRGRSFSTRTGLIGRAWRMEQTKIKNFGGGVPVAALIKEWGMTPREAASRHVDKTKVMIAILLRDETRARRVGLLYLDSDIEGAFGKTPEEQTALVAHLEAVSEQMLVPQLVRLVETALRNSPQLYLEGS